MVVHVSGAALLPQPAPGHREQAPVTAVQPSQDQRRAEYEAYLASPAWQKLRRQALQRDGHACRVCNRTKRLDVHHRTYERFGHERLDDLTVLCRPCHETFHLEGKPVVSMPQKKKATKGSTPRANLEHRIEDRVKIEEFFAGLEPGALYTTREIAARTRVKNPATILKSLEHAGAVTRVSKRQWRKPFVLVPAGWTPPEEDRFRQLPKQVKVAVKTRRGSGQPSALDKFSLRAEQDRKTRSGGRTSTG